MYAFSSITFTPAGASGRSGPTLAQALAYYDATGSNTWVQHPAFYSVINNGTQVGRTVAPIHGACLTMRAACKQPAWSETLPDLPCSLHLLLLQ